ncbi:hypothetical protein ACFL1H_05790 [Nanoarchaeota archaeon]
MKKAAKQDRIRKRNNILIGIFFSVLMVASIFGITAPGNQSIEEEKLIYGDFEFIKSNQYIYDLPINYILNFNDQGYGFTYFPDELENITVETLPDLNVQGIYIIENYSDTLGINLPTYSISMIDKFKIQQSCYINDESCPVDQKLPQIDCSKNESILYNTFNIINLKVDNITKITTSQNCIILQGIDNTEILKTMDRLKYKILGVME